jgi:hypothetical protein
MDEKENEFTLETALPQGSEDGPDQYRPQFALEIGEGFVGFESGPVIVQEEMKFAGV